jgi:hypothetical protein
VQPPLQERHRAFDSGAPRTLVLMRSWYILKHCFVDPLGAPAGNVGAGGRVNLDAGRPRCRFAPRHRELRPEADRQRSPAFAVPISNSN